MFRLKKRFVFGAINRVEKKTLVHVELLIQIQITKKNKNIRF